MFLVYILFLFCLFSCSKDNNNISIIKENPELSCLHEAKYSDIPVPVNYYSVNSFLKESGNSNINNNIIYDNNSLICYSGKLPIESVIDFYLVNLEANGWQFTDYSVFQNQDKYIEGLFFCEKSSKSCIISIRPENINSKNNRNLIYIFLKNKLKIQDKSNQSTKNIDPDIINSKQL
ncbi:hypothetical protein K9L05_02750 [Candidatus Babeliales bacterium]|nr:hypothetical protein [Candidatus Babeliales bacterium]MCF7899545.1 hypothetical protein [Candidatus Babeliales bacterium]